MDLRQHFTKRKVTKQITMYDIDNLLQKIQTNIGLLTLIKSKVLDVFIKSIDSR